MKIGIVGATGYTGLELLRLLAVHPEKPQVAVITSRQEKGRRLTAIFPALSQVSNYDELVYEAPEAAELAGRADLFFLAAPHGAAMELVPALLQAGARVVDLSADFRLKSADVFNQWYQPHSASYLLDEAVYGLPELYANAISQARLVANPGCYPTSIILGLAPFLKANLLGEKALVIADSASGVSGAGRGASLGVSFCEVSDSFKAYKVVGHRHTPEIAQELSVLGKREIAVSFTPHLSPLNRGILSTIYVTPKSGVSAENLRELYLKFYADCPFVRVRPLGFEPQTADVRGTNFCDISLFCDQAAGLIKIVSAIDNLCRGASGQAVVNFNLLCGYPQTAGLAAAAVRP